MAGNRITTHVSDGPNRRDLLKGAAGIAAAATAAGLMSAPPFAAAGPLPAQVTEQGLFCSIPGLRTGSSGFRLFSMVWSGSVQGSVSTGGGGSTALPTLAGITVTKAADVHSNALVRTMLTRAVLPSVRIAYNSGDEHGGEIQAFALTNVNVKSMGMLSGNDPFFEELELLYTTITFVRTGEPPVTYNLASATVT